MIILKMRNTGNIVILEGTIKELRERGYDVLIKEEGGIFFFALLGERINGRRPLSEIPFIEFTDENEKNKFLDSGGAGYIETWEFLEKRGDKKEVGK